MDVARGSHERRQESHVPVAAICVTIIAESCRQRRSRGCVALTREHPLVGGGETSVVTNALQRPQGMVVRAGAIRSMMEAGVDLVPAPSPPIKYRWQRHGTFAKGARAGLSVSPERE